MYREKTLENLSPLDSPGRSRGRSVRLAHQSGYESLQQDHCAAAAVSTGMGISCGLDNSLRADGNRGRQNLSFTAIKSAQPGTESVYCPAGGKFLLESHFLQSAGIRSGLFLAAAFVGLVLWMILTFRKVDLPAANLQIPYLLWLTFAAYLNAGV